MIPAMEELSIQAVISKVLLPKEVGSLEQHLQAFGWSELLPAARDLVGKVLDRIHQQGDSRN